ncbi:hypothetical protein D9M68_706110 [compost metagenome]
MLDTVNRQLNITDVSWLDSPVLLPFVPIDFQQELARCQRYYRRISGGNYPVSGLVDSVVFAVANPVMRVSPTANHNMADTDYVAGSPSATQWSLLKSGVTYLSKNSGTFAFQGQGNADWPSMTIYGAVIGAAPNFIALGSSKYVDFSARM